MNNKDVKLGALYKEYENIKSFDQIWEETHSGCDIGPISDSVKVARIASFLQSKGLLDGYWTKEDIIRTIEENNADVSELDFPFGSYEIFKNIVESGYYDKKIEEVIDEANKCEISKIGMDEYIKKYHKNIIVLRSVTGCK